MPSRPDIARQVERGMDGELEYVPNPLSAFAPKNKVYVFNVGPLKHEVAKGSWGTFRIDACPQGQKYGRPLIIPGIFQSSYLDHSTSAMKTDDIEGKHVAQDIVKPNLGGDWSEGQDLTEKGVFWTFNAEPTDEEINTAKVKMEAFFRKQLSVATSLEAQGPKAMESITPTMRLAAAYFGEDRPWNRIYKKLGSCPICSEPMADGTVKHGCGYIADPQRAYQAGVLSVKERNDLLKRRGMNVPEEAE